MGAGGIGKSLESGYLRCCVLFTLSTSLLQGVSMIRLVDLKVPSHVIRGQPVRLECHYDLEGEALYSVKFYKDLHEFYRFLPGDDPPAQIVNLTGVHVDLPNSSDNSVTLSRVDRDGSGFYRCEVSGEAPSFQTVGGTKLMSVVDLPDSGGPQIEGTKGRYYAGDLVKANCTSSRSRPAAKLAWFINQEPVEESFLRHYPILVEEDGMETSILGIEFRVRPKHFRRGDMKLKCIATIAQLYWRSNEESVQGDRPKNAPVMESRDYSPGSLESTANSGGTNQPIVVNTFILPILSFLLAVRLTSKIFSDNR